MHRFPWLCSHLPLAITEAIAIEEAERSAPPEPILYYQDNFPEIMLPSCDG
jgi:hypothetical protein